LGYAVYEGTDIEEIEKLKAKMSKTVVKKIWYDEETDSTLVEASPITGRTH